MCETEREREREREREKERESVCVNKSRVKFKSIAGHWWLTSVILATQEAEIRRITVRSQPGQIFWKILS
jgi:hypothetical protein